MKRYLSFFLLGTLLSLDSYAEELIKRSVDDNDLIISSVSVDRTQLPGSVDLYPIENSYLISIEPLFEILGLKYQINDTALTVYKNEYQRTYFFKENSDTEAQGYWANDGYYQFIDIRVLNELFEIDSVFKSNTLSLNIITSDYQFPVTVIKKQQLDRYSDKLSGLYSGNKDQTQIQKTITIPDEYQLFTMPHGQISASANFNENNGTNNLNAQIVSDFLYHSMNLNVNKSKGSDLVGGIRLSKYKSSPTDKLLGAFDRYSLGDVGGFANELVNNAGSGVGVVFSKSPDNYRRSNNEITIEEQAPPGWDVELFHNNRFIDSQVVPQTGRVVFNNVIVEWGNNLYELRLYGPYGEKEIITKNYQLDSNPLSKGDSAYGLYLLDPKSSVFNNDGEDNDIELNNYGATLDYGVTDFWQLGLGFNQVNSSAVGSQDGEQIVTLQNYLSLPGMLVESNLAINNNDGYAQVTSIAGNLASKGRYRVSYTSAENFVSSRISAPQGKLDQFEARYSDVIGWMPISFYYQYRDDFFIKEQSISNILSYSFKDFRLSNTVTFNETQFKSKEANKTDNVFGVMNLSTTIFDSIRITGALNYQPNEGEVISDRSSLNAQWTYRTDGNIIHNLNLKYLPILETNNRWRANYNASWLHDDFRLSLSALYSEDDSWSVGMNINFFLGYDYHNNRALMSSNLNTYSATLNVNTYLDRQLNGIRDPLDYPLEGVEFVGNSHWSNITSGEDGYTTLPGARVRTPFQFRARWERGGETINNDYVVYTHPGASINVNMPFYLETELAGFIYIQTERADLPANKIEIQLIDKNNNVVETAVTDLDGYYEFLKIKPNQYTLRVAQNSLINKGLNSDVIGFSLNTPATGGFIEMPEILLSSSKDNKQKGETVELDVDDLNEPLIWSDNQQQQKNYFLMPLKNKEISAPHQTKKPELDAINKEFSEPAEKSKDKNNATDNVVNNLPEEIVEDIDSKYVSQIKPLANTDEELYVIQLGAFVTKKAGEEFVEKYSTKGLKPILVEVSSSNANYQFVYKAILSAHKTRALAEQHTAKNKIDYQDYLIVKLKQSELNLSAKQLSSLLNKKEVEELSDNTKNTTITTGWVIQYYAGKAKFDNDVLDQFNSIANLHQGLKTTTSGETYYCLLSRPFDTKQQAISANASSSEQGWVLSAEVFKQISQVENNNE